MADGATVPIYYEPRIVKLTIDEAGARAAEEKIAQAARADESGEQAAENIRIPMEALVRRARAVRARREVHRRTLGAAARRDGRQGDGRDDEPRYRGSAVRRDCQLRPRWHDDDDAKGAMKVIMTGSPR